MLPGTLQNIRFGIVRKNDYHLGIEPTIFDGIKNGLAITARPRT